jgi:hypothetical protein
MLVWANLHGAFVAGFAISGLYLAAVVVEEFDRRRRTAEREDDRRRRTADRGNDRGWRTADREETPPVTVGGPWSAVCGPLSVGSRSAVGRLFTASLLSLAASLANPAGWRLWETTFGFLRNRYLVGHTAEYLPLDFHRPEAWPFLALIAFSILALGLKREQGQAAPVLLLAAWTAIGLYSARNVPLYAAIAAPILAGTVSAPFPGLQRFEVRLGAIDRLLRGHLWAAAGVLLAGLALSAGLRLDFSGQGNRFDPAVFPVAAVDWLEAQNLPGEVFNHFPWGGYLLYRDWPEQRVFIDGQTDFYGEALTRQYEQAITRQTGWQAVLAQYRVGWALLPAGSPLAQALAGEPGWREAYRDGTAVVLITNP